MKLRTVLLCFTVSVLSACSSTNEDLVRQQVELESRRMELETKKIEIEQEKRQQEIDSVPVWALMPPLADENGFYAVGIAESEQMSFAIRKSKLQAEFELAKQYRQLLSGSERSYESETMGGKVNSATEILIDKIIEEVPIVGYDIVQHELKPQNGKHVSYLLLKMPYMQYNKVLKERQELEFKSEMKLAYKDLERRLDKRKAQLLEEKFEENETQEDESPTNDNEV
jgi:hypothetical protein